MNSTLVKEESYKSGQHIGEGTRPHPPTTMTHAPPPPSPPIQIHVLDVIAHTALQVGELSQLLRDHLDPTPNPHTSIHPHPPTPIHTNPPTWMW